jgi:hypothetical protein
LLAADNLEERTMAKRPTGRPKATHPRDVRVTIRLTEEEVDQLYRAMGHQESLAEIIRRCIMGYLALQPRTAEILR